MLRERLPTQLRLLRCTNAGTTKSGGRKPPVVAATAPPREIPHTFAHDHRTRTTKNGGRESPVVPRTQLQRRAPTRRSAVCRTIAEARVQVRLQNHGGLTPAAPRACATTVSECMRNCPCRRDSRSTAGLRQPLLLRVLLCIAKVAISSAGERARTGAGGVNPPWFVKRRFGRRFDSRSTPAVTTVVAATRLQGRPPTHRRQSSEQLR